MTSLGKAIGISIHAPAWGATFCKELRPDTIDISIHAPAWGATRRKDGNILYEQFQSTLPRGERRSLPPRGRMGITFQSTLPRGERRPERQGRIDLASISIHAPAWGATRSEVSNITRSSFQSTLPRGERPISTVLTFSRQAFQSTLPRGERRGRRRKIQGS